MKSNNSHSVLITKILIYISSIFLITSCLSKEEITRNKILERLEEGADTEKKILIVDTLLILSQKEVSIFEVVKEELYFLRRLKSKYKEIIDLSLENKKHHLRGLQEINHLYPTPENKPRLDYIYEHVNRCDSTIKANQPYLDEIEASIQDIVKQDYELEYDEHEYYETHYLLKGKINHKLLNDTVKIYISNDLKTIVSFTNVLYTEDIN
jgi:hypothetical protein